ncbi:hypothetical protein EDB89DRAFT_1912591 [Lactarius sanguifluus]|nr:hypothetical protein EDB89DRAFT_1912591 [Lactarius sanguifluus]
MANTKTHWQVRKIQTTRAHTGHLTAAKVGWCRPFFLFVANPCGLYDSGGHIIFISKASYHAGPHNTQATPPPALCPTDATPWPRLPPDVTTSPCPTRMPPPQHRHHHLHAAISTPSPNCPDARAAAASTDHHPCQQHHDNNNPHVPQPAIATSTITITITTATNHHPPTSATPLPHQPDTPQQATDPVPPNSHQRRRRRPDSTRHATTATPPPSPSSSHPTNPVPLNRPGPTSSL